MDSFEQVVASILERKGYWTRTAFKVALERDDKIAIGKPSSPRWELDVVGYSGRDNHLMVLECKSFLDSPGVRSGTFAGNNPKDEKRYKLFFDDTLRKVVLKRLIKQLVQHGFCAPRPGITFGLAAGKIHGDVAWLQQYFKRKRWQLWTPDFIATELRSLRNSKYENSISWVVAKLILTGTADDEGTAT